MSELYSDEKRYLFKRVSDDNLITLHTAYYLNPKVLADEYILVRANIKEVITYE